MNIGNKVAGNLPPSDTLFGSFLGDRCSHSFYLNPITEFEIVDVISKFQAGKAPGWDGVSSFVIKQARNALAKPLAMVFNKSISSGVFPDRLKTGRVVPTHKRNSKNETCNYRPISILSIVSKIFEKLIFSRMMCFINKHGLLSQSQYGFRAKCSTEMAILDVLSENIDAIEKRHLSVNVFLDSSKAFDTV